MDELQVLNHANLSDTVYATLCDALIKGRFNPGDRLKIRDLAEQLGTSVTPVRDAILRLSHDDALVFQTARNIQIPHMTKARYLEIRAIRLRLEALAAETAASVASQKDIQDVRRILDANEKALAEGDRLAGAELNQAFHFQLATIAKLPTLHSILRRLWLQIGPLIADVYLAGGRDMIDYHYAVLEALEHHRPKDAAEAIMSDILNGGKVLLDKVQGS
ncbi:HTH-type transcriptional regulator McbR [Ensifer psoraleae]|uniref:GntR family transcriptional regulator n=1 Tax=Sinorhizobium psoraleae TaxID=520838 RepID=UPI0015684E9A|nr:GntR family transcriptional regulator [Sinorhizobium psoraleae]NRP72533.1 HTH-type transcriptional regulator McbR [Sinorhizobium psoraleae]